MENEIRNQLETQNKKIDAIFESVEKTRKYFLTMMWITVLMVLIPLLGLMFVIPVFLRTYVGSLDGLL